MNKPPRIIEPFSRTGDLVAGTTADEVACNLAGCTRVSMVFRCQPQRDCPDVWTVFQGHPLSHEARRALVYVARVYKPFRRRAQPAPPGQGELSLDQDQTRQVAELADAGTHRECSPGAAHAHHHELCLAGSSPALPSIERGGPEN